MSTYPEISSVRLDSSFWSLGFAMDEVVVCDSVEIICVVLAAGVCHIKTETTQTVFRGFILIKNQLQKLEQRTSYG